MELGQAITLAEEHFGVRATAVRELGSHQDRNFALTVPVAEGAAAGDDPSQAVLVLKVANSGQSLAALHAQDAALAHLGNLPLSVPKPLPSRAGSKVAFAELGGISHAVRLLTFVPGTPLTNFGYLPPAAAHAIGAAAGAVTAALSDFDHPGAHEPSQWDLARFPEVVAALAGNCDGESRDVVTSLAEAAEAALAGPTALPRQVIHGDLTDFNILTRPAPDGSPRPAGIIDFGDLVHSWRVGELAITICSLLTRSPADPLHLAREVTRGYLSSCALSAPELAVLWPLVTARACAGLVGTAAQLRHEPDNPYLHENLAVDRAVLHIAAGVPLALGQVVMLQLGEQIPALTQKSAGLLEQLGTTQPTGTDPLVADLGHCHQVDLSPASPLLDEGAWLEPEAMRAAVAAELAGRAGVISYGQAHLHVGGPPSPAAPATMALGITALLPVGQPVSAPWPGQLTPEATGAARLRAAGRPDLILAGLAPVADQHVPAGAALGRVAPSTDPALPDHLHLQLAPPSLEPPGLTPPRHCPAHLLPAWSALCPDPSSLLGLKPAKQPAGATVIARRATTLAAVQKTYFADPPEMVRGWQHLLIDASGRSYLDGVNNVAVLGHSHPGVARAVDRALRTLNTNSRFNLAAPVEFAEALLATLPPELDQVFLVSSGSEAVDLALRLARVHTGARDVIALRSAYHGWTTATDEISSALMDNPNALGTRPPWVHLAEPPNSYRGPFRGADAGPRYAADVGRIIAELHARGLPLAGFVCEPALNGNAGGIELPEGYLPAVYEQVRAAGGVVIADEVQVGYGRLGCHFWGFQCSGVVPDVVCLAKATGNGLPVAAVVTRAEIAQSLESQGSFFASMGGTPAGAAAALATLAAIGAQDLMGNAARMGVLLRSGLESLVDRYPMAGAVHGRGLYLGLELVTDPESKEPATAATDALCERLLTLGVVMAATGDHMNVLKIKPPLCIDAAGVQHLISALEVAFEHGW